MKCRQSRTLSGVCTDICPRRDTFFRYHATNFAAGVEHLDTILQPYINVEPGRGAARRDFELQEATITDSRYLDGLSIVVEAPEASHIGTPVLFRGIEVGTVTGMSPGVALRSGDDHLAYQ